MLRSCGIDIFEGTPMARGLRWTYSIQERSDGEVKELKPTTTCRTSFPEDHRVEESSSLSNYHPGVATGMVIPSNLEEYQRKSDRIGEVIFSSGYTLTVYTR